MACHAGYLDYDGTSILAGLPVRDPKAAIFWASRRVSDGYDSTYFKMDVGVWSADGTQASVLNQARPLPAFDRFFENTLSVDPAGALGPLVIDSVRPFGWNIDTALGPVAQRIGYMVFGGQQFHGQAFLDTLDGANDGSTQAVPHGLGMTPEMIVNLNGGAGNIISFGACQLTGGSPDSQWGLSWWLESGGHSVPLGDGIHTQSRSVASDTAALIRWIVNFVPGSADPFENHNGFVDMRGEITAADASDVTYAITAPTGNDAALFGLAVADTAPSSFFIARREGTSNDPISTPSKAEAAMQNWVGATVTTPWDETQSDQALASIGGAGRDPDSQMAVWGHATNVTIPIDTEGSQHQDYYAVTFDDTGSANLEAEKVVAWNNDGIVTEKVPAGDGDGFHIDAGWIIARTSAEKRRRGALPVLGVG